MAQRNTGRIDRFAQMSKQEEIIAKKRQEIFEKQRTAQLAKAVVAAQNLAAKLKSTEEVCSETGDFATSFNAAMLSAESVDVDDKSKTKKEDLDTPKTVLTTVNSFTAKTGKITSGLKRNQTAAPVAEQPPPKVQNSFCNDGSFLENFKKILEKHAQPPPTLASVLPQQPPASEAADEIVPDTEPVGDVESIETPGSLMDPNVAMQHQQHQLPPHSTATSYAFNPNILQQQQVAVSTTLAIPAAFFTGSASPMGMSLHPGMPTLPNVAPPPPPPPPQMPLAITNLAPLYMIPAPEPLQLNAIPAPKDFDLSAIPKPQLNLEAIQMPVSEHQQHQQHQFSPHTAQLAINAQQSEEQSVSSPPTPPSQQQVFSDNNEHNCIAQLPTTVDNLIDMVAVSGDEYEDKLRARENELHPAMWFLFDKNCGEYLQYRQRLNEKLLQMQQHREQEEQESQEQDMDMELEMELEPESQPHHGDENSESLPELLADDLQKNETLTGCAQVADDLATTTKEAAPIPAKTNHCSQHDMDKYDPESIISGDIDSDDEYMRGMMDRNTDNIKRRIECRNELSEEERQERLAEAEQEERRRQEKKKLRKSRWGEKVKPHDESSSSSIMTTFANQNKPLLSTVTRSDPALLQYARLNYGSANLTEEDWKKCEEHYKVNLLYQDMMRKRQEIDRLARNGKFKYEYDSDEDVEGGTWEHKLRCAEMEATQAWAQALTKQSEGKHHIGDFLPPEELKKFMEQYEAKKNNRQPDLSDYKEYKLKEDNIGFQMLQKLGWKEGQGLGTDGAGIVDPVNKGPQREGNQGLGVGNAAAPEDCDNEYEAYRKRMMLAYRFRPNPLNNPRRAYY